MLAVLTTDELRAADALALEHFDESTLIGRAGTAVANAAVEMLGGSYGRRVAVICGKGNNGNDGKVAGARLARRGAKVEYFDPASTLPARHFDLLIDAAYGTGFRGHYDAPSAPEGTPVLAVDIPSGVNGDSGEAGGAVLHADVTVTFAALKPGLLQGDGAELAGRVVLVDIGVGVSTRRAVVVEDDDVAQRLPARAVQSHKWASAVAVVAGSPGMEGAGALSSMGASHAGAGMVRLAVPGSAIEEGGMRPGPWPLEAVRLALGSEGWADAVLEILGRCKALVVGPGLGREPGTQREIRRLIAASPVPGVADADALAALGDADAARSVIAGDGSVHRPVVLTPHDGEYHGLMGEAPGPDRFAAARRLAAATGAVALVKGPLTAVGLPMADDGLDVLLARAGSTRLATAGTGDVLSGIIGALLARGVEAPWAAALGAHVHGRAAALGNSEGLVAGDLPPLVARWLSRSSDPGEPAPVDRQYLGQQNRSNGG
jgi:NAD(P)H-hydrate epimerase